MARHFATQLWLDRDPWPTPVAPEVVAQLVYVNGATEPSYVFIPRRSASGEAWPPLRLSGTQWRLMQLLRRSGSRFI